MTYKKMIGSLLATGLVSIAGSAFATGTIDFNTTDMTQAAYYGSANLGTGSCTGTNDTLDCYYQSGMAIGHVYDPAATGANAHLHRYTVASDPNTFLPTDYALEYHADSSGIYIRSVDGSAFSLDSLNIDATRSANNPLPATTKWEILGFSNAVNPALSAGDGTNYTNEVAYQAFQNGFAGTLSQSASTLNAAFDNVKAVWIHFQGYPATPTNGVAFSMLLDNVVTSSAVSAVPVPAAVWMFGTGLLGLLSFGRKKSGMIA